MNSESTLEISGNFFTHPFAELIAEIVEAELTGSLRCGSKEKKCIFYFKSGRLKFAVSNARSSRLFDILLTKNRISRDDLVKIPNFANDFEFSAFLEVTHFMTKGETRELFVEQIESIVVDVLGWTDGNWSFTSLARVRDGLEFDVKVRKILVNFARCLPASLVLGRFRSLSEAFELGTHIGREIELQKHEEDLLMIFQGQRLTASDLSTSTGIPEEEAIKALYTLWLGGFLNRTEWHPAFSNISISKMNAAKLEIKKEATIQVKAVLDEIKQKPVAAEREAVLEPATISVEDYLERAESADTFYDMLGVSHKSDIGEIKRAYFFLAKQFHPDHYHRSGGELLRRVETAFTKLAQAHETLKTEDSRENYDFKVRRELADKEKLKEAGTYDELSLQMHQASESFERGFSVLMDGDAATAEALLARAAHFAPKNARYHAYYGKALSANDKHRHKAEGEMQTAIKLDPNNPTYRLILAEFFIQVNLLKRAEGELNRLLKIFPSNREAQALLATLQH